MTKLRQILLPACLALFLPLPAYAAEELVIVESLTNEGWVEYDKPTDTARGTNGVIARYQGAVMTAEEMSVNVKTGETTADGKVRLQAGDMVYVGEHIVYNFKTKRMRTESFRAGKPPVFAAGRALSGDYTGGVYTATGTYVTTDDVAEPFQMIRASKLVISPGKYFEAHNAVAYLGAVPVFYFPYYYRRLDEQYGHYSVQPGYRSRFGAFVLGTYSWRLNDHIGGAIQADYREKRGFAGGPELNLGLGRAGDISLNYYYAHDKDPTEGNTGFMIPADRHRVLATYSADPWTNVSIRGVAHYLSDERLLNNFFESEKRKNPQPATYAEVNKLWSDFGISLYAQPRINDFQETVERLPELRLTGFRQQIGDLPFYYESESSAGYYHRRFAETNAAPSIDYAAMRADTYHQMTIPMPLFGWLNFTPRVGGRFTYYGDAEDNGASTIEQQRWVFNAGAELSFKASRLWRGATNRWLEVDGLRHIIEPSANYVYVPEPNVRPPELPQFDYELPSLRLLPLEYPDYNAIDSIDTQNAVRFGLRNRLQTKRQSRVVDLVDWNVYTDWRLQRESGQTIFADLYSDLDFRPTSWMGIESRVRYDLDGNQLRLAYSNVLLQPGDRWSLAFGHWYLRDDFSSSPTALGEGDHVFRDILFYRLNENWGFRAAHYYDIEEGRLAEQFYTVYRDLRSWTAALTVRLRDNLNEEDDITVALTLSLKAAPKYALGEDVARPERLLGR